MTKEEYKEIVRVYGTGFREEDIPAYIRNRSFEEDQRLIKEEIEVNQLLSYGEKHGYISDSEDWSWKEKKDYYDKCMAYEPDQEDLVDLGERLGLK